MTGTARSLESVCNTQALWEAFAAGNAETAFDIFMPGVCRDEYRRVLENRLGAVGLERAIPDSAFFFRDEIPAVLESTFGQLDASRVHQTILVAEGGDSAHLGPLSQQITAHARRLLPHAEVATVEGTNHLMPLQGPETVARLIQSFVNRHASSE